MNELALEQRTLRKVAWRLVPFICVLYVFNILDRSNLGFARLRMQDDLGLTEAMFNLGYGIYTCMFALRLLSLPEDMRGDQLRIALGWQVAAFAALLAGYFLITRIFRSRANGDVTLG